MYCFFLTNTHMINICKTSYNIKKRQNKKSPIGDFFLSLHNKKTLSALILPTEVDLISKVAKISLSAGLLARNHLPLSLPIPPDAVQWFRILLRRKSHPSYSSGGCCSISLHSLFNLSRITCCGAGTLINH